jgi:hypothetical protein
MINPRSDVIHLTPAALAARWSMSVGHLANMRSRGEGPAYLRLGGRIGYVLEDIEAYEASCKVQSKAA